jgi:hypothetical protein
MRLRTAGKCCDLVAIITRAGEHPHSRASGVRTVDISLDVPASRQRLQIPPGRRGGEIDLGRRFRERAGTSRNNSFEQVEDARNRSRNRLASGLTTVIE